MPMVWHGVLIRMDDVTENPGKTIFNIYILNYFWNQIQEIL